MEESGRTVVEEEDLGNYITQVVTDIGIPCISSEAVNKLNVNKKDFNIGDKKLRWKMASVSNQAGVPADEYSKFAVHVYRYLSYIKSVEVPTDEELGNSGKMVHIEGLQMNSKWITSKTSYEEFMWSLIKDFPLLILWFIINDFKLIFWLAFTFIK